MVDHLTVKCPQNIVKVEPFLEIDGKIQLTFE